MLLDYIEETKKILQTKYKPATIDAADFALTTSEVLEQLSNIFTVEAIDVHDIYQVLTEIGYTPQTQNQLEYKWYFKHI